MRRYPFPRITKLLFCNGRGGNMSCMMPIDRLASMLDDFMARPEPAKLPLRFMNVNSADLVVIPVARMNFHCGEKYIADYKAPAKVANRLNVNGWWWSALEWITPNESEAELLTGIKVTDCESAAAAAAELQKRGVRNVLITMGSRGCWSSQSSVLHPAHKVEAVDCVAAGDTFNGAFVVGLAEGMNTEDAVVFAQKAAAISVTRPGAQASVPYRSEIR